MKNELDSKMILRVFEFINQHGESVENRKCFDGVYAFTDYDGYTIYLKSSNVTLSLGFHNTYHLDYESPAHKDSFYQSIQRINQKALSTQ